MNNSPESYNFLVVDFGDNDFGHIIADGLRELNEYWTNNVQNYCPFAIKCFLIAHVVSYNWKKNCLWLDLDTPDTKELTVLPDQNVLNWLKEMQVTFRYKMPTYELDGYPEQYIDHDGGSAAMDLHTKTVFTF
jgi:hypothetical protein